MTIDQALIADTLATLTKLQADPFDFDWTHGPYEGADGADVHGDGDDLDEDDLTDAGAKAYREYVEAVEANQRAWTEHVDVAVAALTAGQPGDAIAAVDAAIREEVELGAADGRLDKAVTELRAALDAQED